MLTPALLLMLTSAGIQPAFLANGGRRSIRLVQDDGAPPPASEPPPVDLPSYAGWSKPQLQAEYDRLKEARPSVGLPIALMSSGGGSLILSLYIVMLGVLSSGGITGSALPFLVLFGIVGTAGAAMLIIGGIQLWRVLPERRPYGLQMDEVDRLLKEEGGDQPPDQRQYVPAAPPYIDGPPSEGPPPLPLPPFSPQASIQFPLIFARF